MKDEKVKQDLKDEEKKVKPEGKGGKDNDATKGNSAAKGNKDADGTRGNQDTDGTKGTECACDETPAGAGEGKRADDAATEELDEKAGKKTSNDSGALAGPKTKPTIRHIYPAEAEQ